jgi:hypothetical protein
MIATQAVQSLAIMIQNVSRATNARPHVLSNNHINNLINFRWSCIPPRRDGTRKGNNESLEDLPVLSWLDSPRILLHSLEISRHENECADLAVLLKYPAESAGVGSYASTPTCTSQ